MRKMNAIRIHSHGGPEVLKFEEVARPVPAVQFAKWAGAHVIGTASASHHEFLRAIGVHEAIDYTTTPFEEAVHDADVVLDTIGGEFWQRSWKASVGTQPGTLQRPCGDAGASTRSRYHAGAW